MLVWFTSVQPLFLAVEGLSFTKKMKRQDEFATITEQFDDTQYMLGFSMAVFLFCLHGLMVLWPKGFEGELTQHDISCCSNG